MAEHGSLSLLSRCVNEIGGINAQSYSAETSCDEVVVVDECGENAKVLTKNVMSQHEWEGQVLGGGAAGIVAANVGAAFVAPAGIWLENSGSPGSVNIMTSGRYNETPGEYATFLGRLTNREGV